MKIKYLDLPELSSAIELDYSNIMHDSPLIKGYYGVAVTNEELKKEVREIFSPYLNAPFSYSTKQLWAQLIDPGFNDFVHQDPRNYSIAYIIDPGGDNVKTTLFKDSGREILDQKIIQPNRWHFFPTYLLHSVSNIEYIRTSVSISIFEEIPADFLDWLNSKVVED